MQGLQWSGSHLGSHSFNNVIQWMTPAQKEYKIGSVAFQVIFVWQGQCYLAYLKRNNQSRCDTCILDEIKPLFGLRKMGTHRIRLDMYFSHPERKGSWFNPDGTVKIVWTKKHADYILIKSEIKIVNSFQQFAQYYTLNTYPNLIEVFQSRNEEYANFRLTLQKIQIYKLVCRIDDNTSTNILVHADNHSILSIGESKIVDLTKAFTWLPDGAQQNYFPKIQSKECVVCKMFNLNRDNYSEELNKLQQSIYDIIIRIDDQHIWLADHIYSMLDNLMSNYFHNPLM